MADHGVPMSSAASFRHDVPTHFQRAEHILASNESYSDVVRALAGLTHAVLAVAERLGRETSSTAKEPHP